MVFTARGAEQHAQGTATVLAWIDVALALGLPGRPFSGYGCLTGQGNGQGGREHGQKADQLPGYRMIDDPAAREHVARVWGVGPESLPGKGRSAYELLDALGTLDGPRALLVFGSNIVVSAPNATHVTQRLTDLDLLVVADIVLSETAALADVVLPVTQWAEESGTMTNLEGRVILREQAVAPPTACAAISTCSAASPSGSASTGSAPTPSRSSKSSAAPPRAAGPTTPASPTIGSGPSTALLALPGPDHPGTPRLFAEEFAHPDGRARFVTVDHTGPAEPVDAAYPIHLTTGRVLAQYQSGAQTRRVRDLPDVGAFVELHPFLADRIGAYDGEPVVVTTRRGELKAPARVTDPDPPRHRLRPLPLGRRQPAHDRRPGPGEPDAGVQSLRLRGSHMSRQPIERIVVVGAGMAAARLAEQLGGSARPGDPARRRAAPAVQPDPALGPPRGHARARRPAFERSRHRRDPRPHPGRRLHPTA